MPPRSLSRLLAVAWLLVAFAPSARGTPDFSDRTGEPCVVCHQDAAGGGTLTRRGAAFAAAGYRWPVPEGKTVDPAPAARRWLRVILGFVHLSTAVVWFGTIFYVHLVLGPKYALGGLPPLEVRLAWVSMALLAASGVPLTYLRFHGLGPLSATRAGTLLLVKIGLFLFLVASAGVVTAVVGPRLRRRRRGWSQNDGREGRSAWVQVGERLYDVTTSPRWKGGSHFRRHQAGQDLTEALAGAPHGSDKLAAFPSVSAEPEGTADAPAVRVFYVMAYLNLLVAVAVLVVLSLWRWG